MQEVIISENVTSIVDAKKIIDSIAVINNKIDESKQTAENLIKSVNSSSESLQKAKNDDSYARRFLGWKSETLFEFIIESRNITHTSVSSISKLIQNNNDNSKLLAEMISKLAMLSCLSFEKISETTEQLEEMAKNFEQNSGGYKEQAGQIKRVILAHINKIKEEKIKSDRIENNFKELNEKLNVVNAENEKRIILIQELLNSKSEDHFIKVQNNQRKIINYLAILSLFTFSTILLFLIYFFFYR